MSQREGSIKQHLQAGDYKSAAKELELNEFEFAAQDQVPVQFYGVHLLTYLALNDLNNARFLWKRIPADIKKGDTPVARELNAIWNIGKGMWAKNYSNVYKAAASELPWSEIHASLVNVVRETFPLESIPSSIEGLLNHF
eukprot:TRINITY_DN277_c0_g1_i2.p1 TRINITY_DN277_c0_g1~~TRINITY_DN277_c0_g1_i2.p1  ORF type:complete len:140 (-),score=34.14 TRINITY_DN277_c0_g1_i2:250-669(-)